MCEMYQFSQKPRVKHHQLETYLQRSKVVIEFIMVNILERIYSVQYSQRTWFRDNLEKERSERESFDRDRPNLRSRSRSRDRAVLGPRSTNPDQVPMERVLPGRELERWQDSGNLRELEFVRERDHRQDPMNAPRVSRESNIRTDDT